jgi:hypothetical protein
VTPDNLTAIGEAPYESKEQKFMPRIKSERIVSI